jgi:hypothetical protein
VDLAFEKMHRTLSHRYVAEDDEDSRPAADVVACRERIIAWMLFGYRKAVRRYRDTDPYWVGGRLFDDIAKGVDALLRSDGLEPGSRVRVSAHPAVGRGVTIHVRQPGTRAWMSADRFC